MSTTIAVKFGGSSLASAEEVQKVVDIVSQRPTIRAVVVSAPGKRSAVSNDVKVTDLLLNLHQAHATNRQEEVGRIRVLIRERYLEIASAHSCVTFIQNIEGMLNEILETMRSIENSLHCEMYVASRGEYLMAKLMAEVFDWEFLDATEIIKFNDDGTCAWGLSADLVHEKILMNLGGVKGFVIPGFYGAHISCLKQKDIRVFSRNGSDITGAIVAAGMDACEYQNWTDSDGLVTADPHLVPEASSVPCLTYAEAREATYGGTSALHPLALYPVECMGIPTHILNVQNPHHEGTLITCERTRSDGEGPFTMVTGRAGFSCITITMPLMNITLGFLHQATGVLLKYGISIERSTDEADVTSLVVDSKKVSDADLKNAITELQQVFPTATVVLERDIALVVALGAGMKAYSGAAMRVIGAVTGISVNILLITQPRSEGSITVSVSSYRLEDTIRAVHKACFA